MQTAVYTHPDCLAYDIGTDHPESPGRLSIIYDHLLMSRLDSLLSKELAPLASEAMLERVHTREYLQYLKQMSPSLGKIICLDEEGETCMSSSTLQAAYRAAGAAVAATDAVLAGGYRNAFCATRPPGHHAEPHQAKGFCFLNNVAIAARHALEVHHLKRIAIIDFDAHHANGTEKIFLNDPNVLFCNLYESPLFPFVEGVTDASNIVNLSFPALTKGSCLRDAIEMNWLPRLEKFKPQMIFISAGFDGHYEDEQSHLCFTENDFEWMTLKIVEIANKYAKGRIVSCLEGGYHLSSLARSVVAHLRVLMEG